MFSRRVPRGNHGVGSEWTGGHCWILAANTRFDPKTATFAKLPDRTGATLEVVTEDREVAVRARTFTDRLQPCEVPIYRGTASACGAGVAGIAG